MSFTFSHPAAIIPLSKNRCFVFSALVIGSMSPDFDSFLHLSTDVSFGHSFSGLILFCIPSGLLIFLIFHFLLKYPLISLFPADHQRCLLCAVCDVRIGSLRQWARIVLSLAAGALTHILWDAATHKHGFFVAFFPFLKESVYDFRGSPLHVFTVLQHGGTLAGGIFLLYRYQIWYNTAPASPEKSVMHFSGCRKFSVISLISAAGVSAGIIYAFIKAAAYHGIPRGCNFLRDTVLMGISAIFVGVILFSIYCLLMEKR